MAHLQKLIYDNQQLKRQISQYKQVLGVSPYVDDTLLKGSYKVVKTIEERDKIDCCHRKQGMKVVVIGDDLSFKEYILRSQNCKENIWDEAVNTFNYYTKTESDLRYKPITYVPTWSEISGKPTSFTPSVHNHTISEIVNLESTLNGKENNISLGTIQQYFRGDKTWQILDKNVVGLSNVDNTSDLEKPISNLTQQALNEKQKILSSYDESLLIEDSGNIEGNVSLFQEYFTEQNCILHFIPIQIVGVYKNGIKLKPSDYTISLPKTISINTYIDENIEIQYTKLKI